MSSQAFHQRLLLGGIHLIELGTGQFFVHGKSSFDSFCVFQQIAPAILLGPFQVLWKQVGMVNLDVGEFGDGGCLEQTGIIQPGAVKGQKIQLAALQGGQAPAVNGGIAVQQQIA